MQSAAYFNVLMALSKLGKELVSATFSKHLDLLIREECSCVVFGASWPVSTLAFFVLHLLSILLPDL